MPEKKKSRKFNSCIPPKSFSQRAVAGEKVSVGKITSRDIFIELFL